MGIIDGRLAMVHRSDNRPYAEGLHFLARIVQETMCLAYFYRRLEGQLAGGTLHGVECEQARWSQIACFKAIVVNVAKLLEDRKDTWNLVQLHKEWSKYVPDRKVHHQTMTAIHTLRKKLAWVQGRRHEREAHQTKADQLTLLTALPPSMDFVKEVAEVMDLFVEGKIPYQLYLHESGEEIDLRAQFGI